MPPVICWCCKAEIEAKAAGCASCACLLLVRGKYRILGLLGEGGMGAVYEATDRALDRRVAIKLMHDRVAGSSAKRDRFFSECKAMAKLDHPGIARIYEADVHHDQMYFVQELVAGVSLKDKLAAGLDFDQPSLARFTKALLGALAHAHGEGIAHRVVNPNNILVVERAEEPLPVLIDFGMARLSDQDATRGAWGGTPGFAAPEQLLDPHSNDNRSDLYGVGAVLFNVLTQGGLPYSAELTADVLSNPGAMVAAYKRIADGQIELVAPAQQPHLDEHAAFMTVLERALAPGLDDRFADAKSMIDALDGLVGAKEKEPAEPESSVEPEPSAEPEPSVEPEPSAEPEPSVEPEVLDQAGVAEHLGATEQAEFEEAKRRVARFKWGALAIVAVIGASWLAARGGPPQPPTSPPPPNDAAAVRAATSGAASAAASAKPQGSPAIVATPFIFPAGVAVAGDVIYVADQGAERIQIVRAGVATTLAGSGIRGYADGNAAQAHFAQPADVAVGADGTVYVADTENHRIRAIANGKVTTLAGGFDPGARDGAVSKARFRWPEGVAITADGSVLVADTGNHRIRKIANGKVSTMVGDTTGNVDGPLKSARLSYPSDLVEGPDGVVYFVDSGNFLIRSIVAGKVKTLAKLSDVKQARAYRREARVQAAVGGALALPRIAVAADSTVYVTDPFRRKVLHIKDGEVSDFAGSGKHDVRDDYAPKAGFWSPQGVVVAADGAVIVVDTEAGALRRIADGKVSTLLRGPLGGYAEGSVKQAQFNHPWSIAVGPKGELLVADWLNYRVRLIENQQVITIAGSGEPGSHEGDALNSELESPRGVAFGPGQLRYVTDPRSGRVLVITKGKVSSVLVAAERKDMPESLVVGSDGTVYLADPSNHQIFAIRDGKLRVFAGSGKPGLDNGAAGEATFNRPFEVALGSDGVVYVADTGNHCVRIIRNGRVHSLAGSGEGGHEDGQARQARFELPVGIAVDPSGAVYVADTGNHCIRRIARGLVTTVAGTGEPGFADGPGLKAALSLPTDVAVAPDGSIYIADAGNHLIRRLSGGHLSTFAGLVQQ